MDKLVYQLDHAGFYLGETVADESPLDPGIYLLPARCVETPPPATWEDSQWPRWDGSAWRLVNRPKAFAAEDPVDKLKAFLAANPDVAQLIGTA
ncbi:phage tail protein [Pseudomonas oryzihabitans]|nr:phage tail protein [Pseudomonas psychrotolerans]